MSSIGVKLVQIKSLIVSFRKYIMSKDRTTLCQYYYKQKYSTKNRSSLRSVPRLWPAIVDKQKSTVDIHSV